MQLLGATCIHTAVFLNSFLNDFWPVSGFAYVTCQSGKGKTGLHSSLLLVSAVKCIQVAKWRGIPDFLTDGWSLLMLAQNSSTYVKTKIRRILLSCRWHGSSCIQSHFEVLWQSLSKWHLCPSEHCCHVLRLCLLQELSTLLLLQCKSSFAKVQGSSARGPAGACS